MGSITVRGQAKRSIESDRIRYTLDFTGEDRELSAAITKAEEETEVFLKRASEAGIDITKMQLAGDRTGKSWRGDEEKAVFTRSISFLAGASGALMNRINGILKEEQLHADFRTETFLSKEKEIRSVLLEEAVNDSKKKAETLAGIYGQTITGIEKISYDRYDSEVEEEACCDKNIVAARKMLSEELKNSFLTFEETVYVTWKISD